MEARAGSLDLFELGAEQDYGTAPGAGRWRFLWAHFQPKPLWQPLLQWPAVAPGFRHLEVPGGGVRARMEGAFRRAVAAVRSPRGRWIAMAFNALEEALLWAEASRADGPWSSLDPRIQRAVDELTTRFDAPFSLERLAGLCGMSVSRFSHLFREETGVAPQRFAERQRLQHARELLRHSALGVAQVAGECGYGNAFYFTNRFRRAFGVSPSAYRAKGAAARSLPGRGETEARRKTGA